MKKTILLTAFLSLMTWAFSQELTITNPFRESPTDRDALTNKVYDNNHELCALVKVGLVDAGATFAGNVIRTGYSHDVWWVYMSEGSTSLTIETSGHQSKKINFSEALIGGVSYRVDLAYHTNRSSAPRKELSEEDRIQIKTLIEMKVEVFQGYVTDLAGDKFTRQEKEVKYQEALTYFIGKGNRYETVVPSSYGGEQIQWHEPVQMGVFTSKYNPKRKYQPMKDYLTKLMNNKRYDVVNIEYAQGIKIDTYTKVGDGRYMAVAHFLQKYTAQNKDYTYWDYTEKNITIYINRVEVDLPNGEVGHYWEILLGDVDCDDVWGD